MELLIFVPVYLPDNGVDDLSAGLATDRMIQQWVSSENSSKVLSLYAKYYLCTGLRYNEINNLQITDYTYRLMEAIPVQLYKKLQIFNLLSAYRYTSNNYLDGYKFVFSEGECL